MMKNLGIEPDKTLKRLGDNFYENRLIKEQIFTQTGKRYLNDSITDDYTQYKYLMDNAIKASKDLDLTPFVSLSKEQINALNTDIVWLERVLIQKEEVLIPKVYLSHISKNKRGANIEAVDTISLQTKDIINQGNIKAGKDLTIISTNNIIKPNRRTKSR